MATSTVRDIDITDQYDGNDDDQQDKYLLFSLGGESYGIAISSITEIIEMQNITTVPDMPDYVKGVVNLRGRVVPMVDLRLKFGLPEKTYGDRTCTIIISIENMRVGFIVDTVAEVQRLDESAIDPPPAFRSASGGEQFIAGMGKLGDDVIILIEPHQILLREELEVISKAT